MIKCKLIHNKNIIETNVFHKAMDSTANEAFNSYCVKHDSIQYQFIEKRFNNFTILRQLFQCKDKGQIEIDYEGEPLLLISIDNQGNALRTRADSRLWQRNEVNLTISPQNDIAVTTYNENSFLEFFNFILPKHYVKNLCDKYPDIFSSYMESFSLESPIYFSENNIPICGALTKNIKEVEHYNDMGNYAEKYLESKILDCLSIIFNRIDNSMQDLYPVNITLSNKMHDVKSIILSQYKEPPSLHELALMVGTNECTLKSAFKHEFSTTVFQYIFNYRMELATQYLLDSKLSIAEIGMLLGYNYQSHFCTAFQRKYMMSPTEFRNQNSSS
jgi:AraC-like DNA-binding protein